MLKLLRRLVSAGGQRPVRPARPTAATSDILSRRTTPVPPRTRPGADGVEFDPYNTGAFDRGASWERISKRDY